MKGITVSLAVKTKVGTDAFNQPVFEEIMTDVPDVLVGEPSSPDIVNALTLYGAKVAYTLGIPKGDTHNWEGTKVVLPEPFAGVYHTVGVPTAGIEANVPTRWNKKVHLERYEGKAEQEEYQSTPSI